MAIQLSQDLIQVFQREIDSISTLVNDSNFSQIKELYSTTPVGRMSIRLSTNCIPALAAELKKSTDDKQILELLQLIENLSLDEDCVVALGMVGLHKKLLNMSMLGTSDGVATLLETIISSFSSTCSNIGLCFPISPNHHAMTLLEDRPLPIVIKTSSMKDDTFGLILRQVRSKSKDKGQGDKVNYDVGNRLWGASLVQAQLLCEMGTREQFRGKKILEVGAGLGLSGMIVSQQEFGAQCVTITDFNPQVLSNLRYNIALNFHHSPIPVNAVKLDWDDLENEDFQKGEFDIVIGSDVICQPSDCEGVLRVVNRCLSQQGIGYFTLGSEKSRFGVDSFRSTFEKDGKFKVTEIQVDLPKVEVSESHGSTFQGNSDDPWGSKIDKFDIGNAASYRHFEVTWKSD